MEDNSRAAIRGSWIQAGAAVLAALIGVAGYLFITHSSRPRLSCADYATTYTGASSKVTFRNFTDRTVSVSWVDQHGRLEKYFDLPTHENRVADTFQGHGWCVQDAVTGKVLVAVQIASSPEDVDVPIEGSQ